MDLILLIVNILLQARDFTLTYRSLRHSGKEMNGIVRKVMDTFGLKKGLILAKALGVVIGLWAYWYGQTEVAIGLAVLMIGVVINNEQEVRGGTGWIIYIWNKIKG